MAYVTPGTVAAGDVATAAAWNVLTNNSIAHQAAIRVSQVISTTYSTQTFNNTSTYAATGLSLAITPASTASKILVVAQIGGVVKGAEASGNAVNLRITRGGSSIYDIGEVNASASALLLIVSSTLVFLDSPASAAATTYAVQHKNTVNGATTGVQYQGASSSLTLFEILP
jgi:hypothetical protein